MGNSEGLVSVIMPIYNSEIFLSAAIESVLSQSYALFELLLVDDGSSDRSYDIMKEYEKRDTRVKCFCKKTVEYAVREIMEFHMHRENISRLLIMMIYTIHIFWRF